jgi:hypothetical protein
LSLTTGQVFFTHTDAVVGEVEVSRTYDTIRLTPGRYGSFGPGWNGSLERRLRNAPSKPCVYGRRSFVSW